MKPGEFSFSRYLEAKKSVDDRSLNRNVWNKMASLLSDQPGGQPIKVFEVGAGIGTMLARMIEQEPFGEVAGRPARAFPLDGGAGITARLTD